MAGMMRSDQGMLENHHRDAHAAYLSNALASDDPALVTLALNEIGTPRHIPVALDDNPPLGEALRAVRALGFDLAAVRALTVP